MTQGYQMAVLDSIQTALRVARTASDYEVLIAQCGLVAGLRDVDALRENARARLEALRGLPDQDEVWAKRVNGVRSQEHAVRRAILLVLPYLGTVCTPSEGLSIAFAALYCGFFWLAVREKGYPGTAWWLVLAGPVGLVILLLLPNRSRPAGAAVHGT